MLLQVVPICYGYYMVEIFTLLVLLFSLVIHEVSHGQAALFLGDPTAKLAGRLSLNPVKHLDLFGSLIIPGFLFLMTGGQGPIFGWAKPVPINPYNFRDRKWGEIIVSLAGPLANFSMAIFFGLIIRFFLLPPAFSFFLSTIVIYNLFLGFFNLMPIPPLDGSHLLFALLPQSAFRIKQMMMEYGMMILIFFILFGSRFLGSLVFAVFHLLVG